jgi:hypothetical protein
VDARIDGTHLPETLDLCVITLWRQRVCRGRERWWIWGRPLPARCAKGPRQFFETRIDVSPINATSDASAGARATMCIFGTIATGAWLDAGRFR